MTSEVVSKSVERLMETMPGNNCIFCIDNVNSEQAGREFLAVIALFCERRGTYVSGINWGNPLIQDGDAVSNNRENKIQISFNHK